jgi:multidrug transporter EmrE-like cation transporter
VDFLKEKRIWSLWLPMAIGIVTYCIGDVLLKVGNYELGSTFVSIFQGDFWVAFITNILIIFAFVFILASKLIMGYVYAKNPFGLTQGLFLAFSVIVAFILGYIIFSEMIAFTDVIAIAAISLGIILVYTSKSYKVSSSEK